MEMIKITPFKGLENFKSQENTLSTVDIDIKNDKPWTSAIQYRNKGCSYRFITESLLLSVSIKKTPRLYLSHTMD